jgi:DNA-binding NarL/FixJ family response regulator
MPKLRIVIFEDNNDLRDSLSLLIEGVEDFELAGSFPNAQRLIPRVEQSKPDVILMDINMPGLSGIDAVKEVHEHFPAIRILMQTVFDEEDKVFASLCAGASGYVLKNTPPDRMLQAIREVAEGGVFFTPAIAAKVMSSFQQPLAEPEFIQLTDREKEVLQHMIHGYQFKAIAEKIFLSYETVHSHVKKIYEKLHVNSKSAAVAKAIRNKLV